MKRLFRIVWKGITWVICRLLPIDAKKVVITSHYGRGYGDNLKYIAEKLLRSDAQLKIVWLVKSDQEKSSLPEGITACKTKSIMEIYHLSTAKVWIDNCRKGPTPFKRKSQFYIQTWHGGGAQKRCEKDVEETLGLGYVRSAKRDSAIADLFISDSRFMTDLYHRAFWYDGPVYECGYPRYDILLKHDEKLVSKVYDYYGIDPGKALVLYAPTFRADHSFKAYNIDFERLRNNLNQRFQKDHVIMVHLHPNVANVKGGIDYNGSTVINCTFYPDMQELITVSSVLIGDYSSVNYEFSLKRQPVFRYTADLDEYRNDRDFYFVFEEYPYPYAQNNDELEALILNFDEDQYIKALDSFFKKLGSVITDDASENVANLILDYLSSKDKRTFFEKNKARFIY